VDERCIQPTHRLQELKVCVSEGWEDPSLIQSICGLGRLEGSPSTLPRLGRVGLCDKDRVLRVFRCLTGCNGFRVKDALEVGCSFLLFTATNVYFDPMPPTPVQPRRNEGVGP